MIDPGPETEVPSPSKQPENQEVDPLAAEQLSAEEQMALYEKELKENDWGHQPC